MNRSLRTPLWLAAALAPACLSAATVVVNDDITTDTVWTADNEYVLNGIIYVANGATLTVQPGTVIRGNPDSLTPASDSPGALIIARGSKIYANGTAEKPIIMTSLGDDNFPWSTSAPSPAFASWSPENVALYGSLAILGNASINGGTTQVGTGSTANFGQNAQLEGLPAKTINTVSVGTYGGLNDDDSSGSVRYLSLRYGGFGLSANSEINGLTLGAVGRGTTLEYIEVMNNVDDGVELFGGTANLKHLSLWGAGDDAIDYDQGWRGKLQFVFIVQAVTTGTVVGSGFPDKIAEMDGGIGGGDGTHPWSIPAIYNVTAVGLGSNKAYTIPGTGSGVTTGPQGNLGLVFRDNAGGRFYNNLLIDVGGTPVVVENISGSLLDSESRMTRAYTSFPDPTVTAEVQGGTTFSYPAGKPASYWYRDEISAPGANQLALDDSVFVAIGGVDGNVATSTSFASLFPTTQTETRALYPEGGHSGDNAALALVTAGAGNRLLVGTAITDVIRGFARSSSGDATVPDPVSFIDPRPRVDGDAELATLLTTGRTAPSDGFFSPVSYKGAFSPTTNWLAGWSTAAVLGLFGEEGRTSGPAAVAAAISQPLAQVSISNSEIGVVYGIYSSATVDGSYTLIGTIGGNGGTVVFADLRDLPAQQFYRVEAL